MPSKCERCGEEWDGPENYCESCRKHWEPQPVEPEDT